VIQWYLENMQSTELSRPGDKYMTAYSALDEKTFRQVVRAGVGGYFKKLGHYPNFLTPETFGATNVLHSLTMPFPILNPANKLRVNDFIPKKYSRDCRAAEIARIFKPGDKIHFDGLKPGSYFFKPNHASALVMKIKLPCSDEVLAEAQKEFERWMERDYGLQSSQWWYRFIDRRGFLEEDLSGGKTDAPLTDFRFHVINGKSSLLQVDIGHGTGGRHNPIYDNKLNYLPYEFLRENFNEEPLPDNIEKAQKIAEAIAAPFQYCRVDLYIPGEQMFLGEMTFLPNAGRRQLRSPELNEILCEAWGSGPELIKIVDAKGVTIKHSAPVSLEKAA